MPATALYLRPKIPARRMENVVPAATSATLIRSTCLFVMALICRMTMPLSFLC